MSATLTDIEFSDLPLDEKLDILHQSQLELHEKLDEILEKLDNLGTPGSGYSVFES